MQAQDYLPFFDKLLTHWYQFTLDNSAYAVTLAVVIWLLTAVFYSLRIAFLNRKIAKNIRGRLAAEQAQTELVQHSQQLQEQLAISVSELEQAQADALQQTQRADILDARVTQLGSKFVEALQNLATVIDLEQPLFTSAESQDPESVWQRFNAAVQRLSQDFAALKQTNTTLQQTVTAEIAKQAEKDAQLQGLQSRLDSQSLQLSKLEVSLTEQKALLIQQQQAEQQKLAELEAKYQASQPKANPFAAAPVIAPVAPQPAPVKVEPVVVAVVEPDIAAEPVKESVKPVVVSVETVVERAEQAVAEIVKKPVETKTEAKPASKFGGMFSNAMKTIGKLDEKFGSPSTPAVVKEQDEDVVVEDAPVERLPEPVVVESIKSEPAKIPEKSTIGGIGGKFKSLLGSKKTAEPEQPTEQKESLLDVLTEVVENATDDDSSAGDSKVGKLSALFKRRK